MATSLQSRFRFNTIELIVDTPTLKPTTHWWNSSLISESAKDHLGLLCVCVFLCEVASVWVFCLLTSTPDQDSLLPVHAIPCPSMPKTKFLPQKTAAPGRISFVYWLFDMPLHFLFGLEIQGSVELRPTKLARRTRTNAS